MLQFIVDSIHAIWPMDEYAKRLRSCDWFIPPIPPIIALNIQINIIMGAIYCGVINTNSTRGLIFCQVARIKHINQGILDITWGSHWWHGVSPNFITILVINSILVIISIKLNEIGFIEIIPDVNISPLPTACTMKYLTLASVSRNFVEEAIRGMNEIKLSSIPVHRYNQFVLDSVMRVLITRVVVNNNIEGSIKSWKESDLSDIKLEAFIYVTYDLVSF